MKLYRFAGFILYISIFFSSECRFIFQERDSFHSVMFYLSFTTGDKAEKESLPPLELLGSSNFLTIKENLTIRNKIKDLLEEDAYD